jgi:putative hydrolase of HD superfamily
MISKALIDRLFGAASIQRWNDHVRPVELTELDKQGHKAFIMFLLAKFEEDRHRSPPIDWSFLIDGLIFEFLPRVVLTDLKAPFFHRLMNIHGEKVNRHVLKELEAELASLGDLHARLGAYLAGDRPDCLERRILKAAHYLATQWEFRMVYHSGPFLYGIENTRVAIENQLEDYIDLIGVRKINLKQKAYGFVDLCGQLRFQQRWAQTPRMPSTSVLGHSLFTAILMYLFGLDRGFCPARRKTNFLVALMHDLPEVFTRDIITPIKRSIEGLEKFVEMEEGSLVRESLLPLMPESWHDQVLYYVEKPFQNRIRENGVRREVKGSELASRYNEDQYEPVDGALIKGCDQLSALIEASKSIETGIDSPALRQGVREIMSARKEKTADSVPIEYFELYKPAER